MRFTVISALVGLVALVSAQNSTATSASLSPQQTCLANCGSSNICCQAACVFVPCPSDLQANATTTCAGECPQGNGSAEDTQKYASCQASCISSNFFASGTVMRTVPTGSASTTAESTSSGSSVKSTSASITGSHSGSSSSMSHIASATGSSTSASAAATHTTNAAPTVRFGAAGAGLVGLFIVGLAL